MSIRKQQFYEGAALHLLACGGSIKSIRYAAPFFVVNGDVLVHLKYSAKSRSPWAFTFTRDEQSLLGKAATGARLVIGLICGADGVAALTYERYRSVAAHRKGCLLYTSRCV